MIKAPTIFMIFDSFKIETIIYVYYIKTSLFCDQYGCTYDYLTLEKKLNFYSGSGRFHPPTRISEAIASHTYWF